MNSQKELMKKKKKGKVFSFKFFLYDFVKWTAALPTLLFLRPKAYYINKNAKKKVKGANFVIANHKTFLDPVYLSTIFWYRRVHFLATQNLFETPGKSRFFKSMLCIPVNKENFNLSTFKMVENCTDLGHVVGIFPEGTISGEKSSINTFHSGVVLMAWKCNAPIVPVYINQRKHWYNRLRYSIGEPIKISDICGSMPSMSDIEKISEILHDKEVELKEFLEKQLKCKEK